jgi:hypothetical protein
VIFRRQIYTEPRAPTAYARFFADDILIEHPAGHRPRA